LAVTGFLKRLRARLARRRLREPFYPLNEHSTEVERQIEVVDPARHEGEDYPSVDVQRRYGRF
jgi:hypothetical protein